MLLKRKVAIAPIIQCDQKVLFPIQSATKMGSQVESEAIVKELIDNGEFPFIERGGQVFRLMKREDLIGNQNVSNSNKANSQSNELIVEFVNIPNAIFTLDRNQFMDQFMSSVKGNPSVVDFVYNFALYHPQPWHHIFYQDYHVQFIKKAFVSRISEALKTPNSAGILSQAIKYGEKFVGKLRKIDRSKEKLSLLSDKIDSVIADILYKFKHDYSVSSESLLLLSYTLLQESQDEIIQMFAKRLLLQARQSKSIYHGPSARILSECLDEQGKLRVDRLVDYYQKGDIRIVPLLFMLGKQDAKQIRLTLNKCGHKRFLYNMRPDHLHMMEFILDRLTSDHFSCDIINKVESFSEQLKNKTTTSKIAAPYCESLSELATQLQVSEIKLINSIPNGRSFFIPDNPKDPNSRGKVLKIRNRDEDRADFLGASVLELSNWENMKSGGYVTISDELIKFFSK